MSWKYSTNPVVLSLRSCACSFELNSQNSVPPSSRLQPVISRWSAQNREAQASRPSFRRFRNFFPPSCARSRCPALTSSRSTCSLVCRGRAASFQRNPAQVWTRDVLYPQCVCAFGLKLHKYTHKDFNNKQLRYRHSLITPRPTQTREPSCTQYVRLNRVLMSSPLIPLWCCNPLSFHSYHPQT